MAFTFAQFEWSNKNTFFNIYGFGSSMGDHMGVVALCEPVTQEL